MRIGVRIGQRLIIVLRRRLPLTRRLVWFEQLLEQRTVVHEASRCCSGADITVSAVTDECHVRCGSLADLWVVA